MGRTGPPCIGAVDSELEAGGPGIEKVCPGVTPCEGPGGVYPGDAVYAGAAFAYSLDVPEEADATEVELFLLPGDSAPRGSIS